MHNYDYHTHSLFSIDSETPLKTMLEAAIALNLKEIAITDHCDFTWPIQKILNPTFCFDKYCSIISELQILYQEKINILLGCEMGIRDDLGDVIRNITSAYAFDFIIGSMHDVEASDFSTREFFKTREKTAAYQEYFERMLKAVQACDFDVLGHMDYIQRYATYSDPTLHYADYNEHIDAVLRLLISTNKGLEINTGSFNYGMNHPHPSFEIICRYRELGGEIITIGSDAHNPVRLGANFDKAAKLAMAAGFKYFAAFSKREIKMLPLM